MLKEQMDFHVLVNVKVQILNYKTVYYVLTQRVHNVKEAIL